MLPSSPLDRLTRLAGRLIGAPVAILTLDGEERGSGVACVIARRAAASRGPVVIADVRAAADPELAGGGSCGSPLAAAVMDGVGACAAVPIVNGRGVVLGALYAFDDRPHAWTDEQVDVLREVAESAAIEIERAAELERLREAERTLREREARLRDLADHASDLIAVSAADRDGRLLYVNEAWKRTFGYDDAEAVGMRSLDVVAPEFHARCLDASRRIVQGEEVRDFQAVLLTKAGRRIVVRGTGSARFENGRAVSVRMMFRDVTAQLQAEMAQSRLVATLGATADFVSIGTVAGAATYINPAGRRMLGIGEDEDITGLPMADVHPAWARERLVREALPAAIRDGAWAGELALLARDGREIPVSQVILAHESPRGGRWFISTVARDISLQKRGESETQLLRATSHAIGAAPDPDAGLLAALRLLCAWAGWPYGEVWLPSADSAVLQCGPVWTAAQDPALAERLTRFAESSRMFAFRAGEGLPGRVWQTRQPVWVADARARGGAAGDAIPELPRRGLARAAGMCAVGAVPVLTHGGDVIAVLTFGADASRADDESTVRAIAAVAAQLGVVIQRKRAEQALRESEARFRRLSDASNDGIAIAEGGTILQVNRAFCELFGCTERDAVGVSGLLFCAPEDRTALARHFLDGAEGRFELTALRTDGSTFRAEVCTATISYAGRHADVLVVRDVSGRGTVTHSTSELVSIVSHELRTPLASIRGALDLLEAGVAAEVPQGMREILHVARANTDRVVRLVDGMLDLRLIESGTLALRRSEVAPRALVDAAVDGARPTADQHRVCVETRVADDAPLSGDAERLTQVLVTLLSNAIKHSPASAAVTLSAARAPSGAARFEVEDRGPGIPAAQIPLLFTRFQKLDPTDALRDGGAGLGLAIARSIVELHGGAIGVESEPGVRTVFWVEVPR